VKWWGVAVLMLCIPAILATHWITFPLGTDLQGMGFSIFAYAPNHQHLVVFSFGVIASLMLALAAFACACDKPTGLYWAGSAMLLVVLWSWLRISVLDPGLLIELARQSETRRAVDGYAVRYLAPNYAIEPTVWLTIAFDTVADRLIAGWYFMALGWYIVGGFGAGLWFAGIKMTGGRDAFRPALIAVIVAVAVITLAVVHPLMAEREISAAARADARGDIRTAVADYRAAMRLDGWYAANLRIYQRIGALDASMGRNATPEYAIYYAEQLAAQNVAPATIGELPAAIAIYERLGAGTSRLSALARMRAADLLARYGLHLQQCGAFGAAVQAWERALKLRPDMWLASFYLSNGYQIAGRYQDAANAAARLTASSDPSFLGHDYSNLGDANFRNGNFAAGHVDYYNSYYLDYIFNRRGMSSLIGP